MRWRSDLLSSNDKKMMRPPFTGGIRNWRRRPDHDAGKYKDGNAPLGFDWENYTMGGLARNRSTYDFKNPDYLRVKEEVLWRIHDLGYSLARFGDIDAQISRSRSFRQPEPCKADRYGKKYSWIAFHELYGYRSDEGLLEDKPWKGVEPHPDDADIDPSFPDAPESDNLLEVDILGKQYADSVKWVSDGPIPPVRSWFVCKNRRIPKDEWVLAHGGVYGHDQVVGRTGYLRIRAHFIAKVDLAKLKRFLRTRKAEFENERDAQDVEGFFAGEFPWHSRIPYAGAERVRLRAGRRKVATGRIPLMIFSLGEKEFRIAGEEPGWRYETVYESVEMVPLSQRSRFGERSTLERPSVLVPSRQIAEFAGLWLDVLSWSMIDELGRPASFSLSAQRNLNSGSSLLVRKDIISAYMKHTRSKLVWVVSGERQRLSNSGMNAAYKQYLQVFLLGRRGPEKVYELRDRHPHRA